MLAEKSFISVTETPDSKAPLEQLERLYSRYHFALYFCDGKDVLEVGCGAGQGLGYISKKAKRVVGGDIDDSLLSIACQTYRNNKKIEIKKVDAQNLCFENGTFDTILLYEAIYYLQFPDKFIREARRVLKKQGVLIICTANKDWSDFNPSPYGQKYFSASELRNLIKDNGFSDVVLYGASHVNTEGLKNKAISLLKRAAVTFNLMPKTMKGKQFLKRAFMGRLYPVPSEITEGMANYEKPVDLSRELKSNNYKIIYAVAHGL